MDALDSIVVHIVIPMNIQVPYKERGMEECYPNFLAMSEFNKVFTFVCVGWEGIAHDLVSVNKTLLDSTNNFSFPPPDWYYHYNYVHT